MFLEIKNRIKHEVIMIEKETIPKNKRMKKLKDMLIIKTVFLYFEFVEKIVNAIISSTNSTDQFKSAVKIGENKTTSTNGLKKLVAPNNGVLAP